jgi:lipoate-protein ligase A
MPLDLLPTRTGGAAENMATDFLLLQRYSEIKHARLRHYGWHRPAFTFGYSQKIAFVRSQLPVDETVELCRRPSGGGIVDHRHDWTYALVIPRGHELYDARATQSYRVVHACLAEALNIFGQNAVLKEAIESSSSGASEPTVCFEKSEVHDVIHAVTLAKIAGAAQKRNKHGLLFQGSLARKNVAEDLDWDAFYDRFVSLLSRALTTEARETPWPEFAEEELSGLTEQYSAPEWIEFR